MRFFTTLVGLLLVAAPAAFAAPPGSTSLDARGVTLERSDTLPRRTYGWNTWLLGSDDVHVVISESDRADRPARMQAFDNKGRPLWTSEHTCPDFDDYTTIFTVERAKAGKSPRLVCKIKKQIIAVDLDSGKEAWRFTDPRPMYITAGAQGRVAVSIDNQQVAVLDADDGAEVARLDVDGAVLEAVAATRDGPMAILVWDTPGRDKDTIELPVGDGGRLEKVELSGDDPGRKLVGVAIGPKALQPAKGAIAAMSPRWRVPFEGYSFEIEPSAGAVVGEPKEGVQAAWDAADGKLLWEHDEVEGELTFYGEDGAGFARPDGAGGFVFGAMDARTRAILWQKPLPPGERPLAGGQGGQDLGVITSGGFHLVRFADGTARFSMPLEPGIELANVRSTTRSLLWVKQRDTERWLHFAALPALR